MKKLIYLHLFVCVLFSCGTSESEVSDKKELDDILDMAPIEPDDIVLKPKDHFLNEYGIHEKAYSYVAGTEFFSDIREQSCWTETLSALKKEIIVPEEAKLISSVVDLMKLASGEIYYVKGDLIVPTLLVGNGENKHSKGITIPNNVTIYIEGSIYKEGLFMGDQDLDDGIEEENKWDYIFNLEKTKNVNIYGINHPKIYSKKRSVAFYMGGDEETLKPARNIIENCKIHDFSQERRVYNPGIALRGVGHVVRSTEIYNGPHMGMIISGNNHLIEYSDFHNCPQEYSDMLAVYMNTGNYPLMRGTVIRRNEFHDVQGSWKQSAGVYLDNETSGVLIEGNYFYRNGAQENGWSVMIHGGADNVVRSNLFVDCSYPFCISLRLNGYAADNFEGLLQRWEKALKEAPKVYYRFYPELNHYFDDEEERPEVKDFTYHLKKDKEGRIVNYWNRRTPSTNVWKDNIIYNNQSVPFCMPVTDKRKNVENRGFYTTGLFRIKNGVRQDNLIHSGNKVLTPEYKKEVSEY
ncbi:right-handed parallel beta-helix repeat-containing protein [Bacteroides xylanisolvens]|uniref:right-handed parallel beta-helix repeat-containing protein n=1 Tax=Bacteroides xylanisolvens TaxID=371601 RepID=UPI001CDBE0ED|nr:right-handed parallel beta-helix repeat-containing protein [Bacteroides xylanisolvens]MCA4532112.1 right-handed parallel beta-helix repeat-containing protein [Bacteroides xylanisolvens]MCA4549989.1 right-handed parallel beta-helix repeat-containing protein [Bacteroides xylanisolvens]